MKRLSFLLILPFAGLFALSAVPASATSINYSHTGTIAPTVNTYASTGSGVSLYYYGSTAGYTDYVGLFDLNTGYNSGNLLGNKSTSVGSMVTVGTGAGQINAGDQLIFYINSPEGIFDSLPAYSADGINHAFITAYSGGNLNGVTVPAGYFVGLEDENKSHSDLNYNDDDFIVTGVSTSVTPEPASLLLMGTGVLGLGTVYRRRMQLARD